MTLFSIKYIHAVILIIKKNKKLFNEDVYLTIVNLPQGPQKTQNKYKKKNYNKKNTSTLQKQHYKVIINTCTWWTVEKNKLRTHHVNISKDLVTKGFLIGDLYQTYKVSCDNSVQIRWKWEQHCEGHLERSV